MSEIEELRAGLLKLRTVTGIVAAKPDLDLEATTVRVNAQSSDGGRRPLVEVSLAECFAEVDALLQRQVGAPRRPAGRRARWRTRSGWRGSVSSHHAFG